MTDRAELQSIVDQAAKAAVEETLLKLGINARDPIAAQQDFIVLREMRELMRDDDFQADLAHIRKWRKTTESIQSKAILTTVGVLITGLLAFIAVGFKSWLGH